MLDMDYRRWFGFSAIVAGFIVVAINAAQGDTAFAVILAIALGAALGALIWWTQPERGGPHTSHADALATAGDDGVIVYWRPG